MSSLSPEDIGEMILQLRKQVESLFSSKYSESRTSFFLFNSLFDRDNRQSENCPKISYRAKFHLLSLGRKIQNKLCDKNISIIPFTVKSPQNCTDKNIIPHIETIIQFLNIPYKYYKASSYKQL